jgi:hypothetical protein
MSDRVIPVLDQRAAPLQPRIPTALPTATGCCRMESAAPARPAHQRHRPLQLPLQLLHAQGVFDKDYQYLPHGPAEL